VPSTGWPTDLVRAVPRTVRVGAAPVLGPSGPADERLARVQEPVASDAGRGPPKPCSERSNQLPPAYGPVLSDRTVGEAIGWFRSADATRASAARSSPGPAGGSYRHGTRGESPWMRAWGRSLRPGHGAGDGPDVPLREHVQAARGGSYVVEQAGHRTAPSLTSLTTHRFANMGSHPDRRPRHPSDMADADWVVVRDAIPVPRGERAVAVDPGHTAVGRSRSGPRPAVPRWASRDVRGRAATCKASERFQTGPRTGYGGVARNGQGSRAVEGGVLRLNSPTQEPCWSRILPHSTCRTHSWSG
jgi:hypothetical protein